MPVKRKRTTIVRSKPTRTRRTRRFNYKSFYTRTIPAPISNRMPACTKINGKDFLPERLNTKFHYKEVLTYSSATVPQSYVYRGNSLYDPNQTGTGAQPIGRDEMSAFYNDYECYASSINLCVTSASNIPYWVYLYPTSYTGTTGGDYSNIENMPYGKRFFVPAVTAMSKVPQIVHYATTKDTTGVQTGDSGCKAAMGANPDNQWFWNIYMISYDNSTVMSFQLEVKICYYTILSGRKVVALS